LLQSCSLTLPQEAVTGIINLEDDEPEIVSKMIDFLYTAKYADDPQTDLLMQSVKIYVIGEKYDVPTLKHYAKWKFDDAIHSKWNAKSFAAALKLMYEETPDKDRLLKDMAIDAAGYHMKELLASEDFAAVCQENGQIAFEILKVTEEFAAVDFAPPITSDLLATSKACPQCRKPGRTIKGFSESIASPYGFSSQHGSGGIFSAVSTTTATTSAFGSSQPSGGGLLGARPSAGTTSLFASPQPASSSHFGGRPTTTTTTTATTFWHCGTCRAVFS
jgi:hypothetical protein